MNTEFPENDDEYQDVTIASLEEFEKGWFVTFDTGWSFWVPANSPVVPSVGSSVRTYGRGVGYVIRGLFVDGVRVYYRTEEEEFAHHEREMYGGNALEMLNKWDNGEIIRTVSMGGFSPGYEQAIQIAAMEMLRDLIAAAPNMSNTNKLKKKLEKIYGLPGGADSRCEPLGLSGAQHGAAGHLAARFYRDGPAVTVKSAPEDRRIMASKHFPSL